MDGDANTNISNEDGKNILIDDVIETSKTSSNIKPISSLIASGGLVLAAGTTFAISAPLIAWAKQYKREIVKQMAFVPEKTLEEIFPDFTDKMPVDFPNKLPVPDGQTILDALDIDEINNIITNDPAFSEFHKRLPAIDCSVLPECPIDHVTGLPITEVIPMPLEPMPLEELIGSNVINRPIPTIEVVVPEGLDEKFNFLQDPKFIAGLGGGVAAACLIAILALIAKHAKEKLKDERIIKNGIILNTNLTKENLGIDELKIALNADLKTEFDNYRNGKQGTGRISQLGNMIKDKFNEKFRGGESKEGNIYQMIKQSIISSNKPVVDENEDQDRERINNIKTKTSVASDNMLESQKSILNRLDYLISAKKIIENDISNNSGKKGTTKNSETRLSAYRALNDIDKEIVDLTKMISGKIKSYENNKSAMNDDIKQKLNTLKAGMNTEHEQAFKPKQKFNLDNSALLKISEQIDKE